MMKFIYLSLLLLAIIPGVNAQTRSTLENFNNDNITSNGRGLITGPIMNNMVGQLITDMGRYRMLNDSSI